jgi:hypothetical protein
MPPALFCFSVFWIGSCTFCLRAASEHDPTYTSHVAGITGMYHHAWLNLLTFYPRCPWLRILWISASRGAGVTGVSHNA